MAFNYKALSDLRKMMNKRAFVPIDAKSAQDAGAMPPPDAGAMPPPGAPMPPPGGDPMAMAGGDPSMMAGGAPMPPPGGDPMAMAGGGGMAADPMMGMPSPDAGQQMSPDGEPLMTANQWMAMAKKMNSFIQSITNGGQAAQAAPAEMAQAQGGPSPDELAAVNAKLDAVLPIIANLNGAV